MASVETTPQRLPSPAERPQAAVVIYDGNCRFCQAQVARLHRCDWLGHLAFLSLHDPEVARRWPELTHDQLMEQMYVVTPGGQKYAGASSLRYLSRHLPPMWLVCPLLHLPGSLGLWKWLYRQIATRRYQLAGKDECETGACSVHGGRRS